MTEKMFKVEEREWNGRKGKEERKLFYEKTVKKRRL